jgi:hypothetical protein
VTDIADFLRARYAERRAIAEAASPGPWHVNAEADEVLAEDGITVCDGFALSGRQLRATTEHIAAHDPEDVLADLDAKLAIVTAYETAAAFYNDPANRHLPAGEAHGLRTALRLLAVPFAQHPDYQEDWRP